MFYKDPPIEINDTYKAYQYLSEENLFVKWPNMESMPPGDYEEYNNTNIMGSVSMVISSFCGMFANIFLSGLLSMKVCSPLIPFIQTWPKWKVVFPDFLNETTNEVWIQLAVEHYNETIQFDGLWLVSSPSVILIT